MKTSRQKTIKTKGVPDKIDKHVGNRLRVRRSLLGFSQEKLAEAAGITFQQVQKYERGANRMSASRLLTFSKLLDIPITYFFEDMDDVKSGRYGFSDNKQAGYDSGGKKRIDNNLLNQKETIELIKAYYAVNDPKLRKDILKFVKSMVKNIG